MTTVGPMDRAASPDDPAATASSGRAGPAAGQCYRVDPEELAVASASLAEATRATAEVAARLEIARGSAPGWAVDGTLPSAFERLCSTLAWAVRAARDDAGDLQRRLSTAAAGYAGADGAATVRTAVRAGADGMDPPGR